MKKKNVAEVNDSPREKFRFFRRKKAALPEVEPEKIKTNVEKPVKGPENKTSVEKPVKGPENKTSVEKPVDRIPLFKKIIQKLKKKSHTEPLLHKPKLRKPFFRSVNPRKRFSGWIEKSGIPISGRGVSKLIFYISLCVLFIYSGYIMIWSALQDDYTLIYALILILFAWTLGFVALLLLLWLIFFVVVDYKIYLRKVGIEEVFPDFLQLTSANIRAGMAIDQALWHAIRPNFGVLAREMGNVAKQTMSGTDLEKALGDFAAKYDSTLLKRSVSLLIEGLNAGGEIGELLDKIATNIQEAKTMRKEMAASVTTYAIFITFASLIAAPFLMALSSQLLVIISGIISNIDLPTGTASLPITFSKVGVQPSDFKIFAGVTLGITSLLSASIVAIIKKGSVKAGIRYLPVYVFTALFIFFILDYILGKTLSGIF